MERGLDLAEVLFDRAAEGADPSSGSANGPFAPAFDGALAWCRAETVALGDHAARDLSSWFLRRAIATARYALCIDQIGSGDGYGSWIAGFQRSARAGNPWVRILADCPVLATALRRLAGTTSRAGQTLAERLAADRGGIAMAFGIDRSDPLSGLEAGLSDPHHGGQSVMRLRFASGRSLIYKPKPLTVEAEFNSFTAEHGSTFGLRSLTILPRDGYGWAEDAGPARRLDGSEPRDGEAMGRAAGLLWLLNATDMHVENVLFTNGAITCLDLETLFAATWIDAPPDDASWRAHSVTATLLFDGSVFARSRIGNISGFDPTPFTGALAADVGFAVEEDRLVVKPVATATASANARGGPARAVRAADPDVLAAVTRGFRAATSPSARALVAAFVERLPGDMPLRFVARETFFYGRILERLRQPRFLRNPDLFQADLDTLHRSVSATGAAGDRLTGLVANEITQLGAGDIPYFGTTFGARTINLSDGTSIEGLRTTPRDFCLAKVQGIEGSDVEEQVALIRIALGHGPQRPVRNHARKAPTREHDLAELAGILVRGAFRPDGEPARWLSLRGDVTRSDLRVAVGDRSFFAGGRGILLAIQAAETVLRRPDVASFLDTEAQRWRPPAPPSPGVPPLLGFAGLGGDILVAAELLRLAPARWRAVRDWLDSILPVIAPSVGHDVGLDVVSGAAGLAIALARCRHLDLATRAASSLAAARGAVRAHILSRATHDPDGACWITPVEKAALLGYAHGWAGFAAALLVGTEDDPKAIAQSKATLDASLRHLAADARRQGGLVEHRSGFGAGQPLNASWCNGGPGFLRGYCARGLPEEPSLAGFARTEWRRMLAGLGTAEAQRFCCGDMGAIDAALDLTLAAGRTDEAAVLRRTGAAVVSRFVAKVGGPVENVTPEAGFPGLFQNIAGVLYTGCRFLDPSLLSLSGQAIGDVDPARLLGDA